MAKAWEVKGLGPDVPLGRCARLILDTRLREMMSYLDGTMRGTDIEMLHSMRVSSRRLRSAMKNFRECFEPVEFRTRETGVRDLARALGAVRDLDVRIAWFRQALAEASDLDRPGLEHLIAEARKSRKKARKPMLDLLRQIKTGSFAEDFLAFVWHGETRDGEDVEGRGD